MFAFVYTASLVLYKQFETICFIFFNLKTVVYFAKKSNVGFSERQKIQKNYWQNQRIKRK